MVISMKTVGRESYADNFIQENFAEIYTERKGEVMGSLDLILTAAALIVGVMLLTGHRGNFYEGRKRRCPQKTLR